MCRSYVTGRMQTCNFSQFIVLTTLRRRAYITSTYINFHLVILKQIQKDNPWYAILHTPYVTCVSNTVALQSTLLLIG